MQRPWLVMLFSVTVGCSCSPDGDPTADAARSGDGGSLARDGAAPDGSEGPIDGSTPDGGPPTPRVFTHPGLLHTEPDLTRMRTKVAAGEMPWTDGWNALLGRGHASLTWAPRPLEIVVRGGDGQNVGQLVADVEAAYALALRWKVSGDDAYADAAVRILDAWSSTLIAIEGNADRYLAAGLQGYELANIGEIMRGYPGWTPEAFARFQTMMLDVFYPMNHRFLTEHNGACISNYWANWDLASMVSVLAIGVLTDREDLYREAIEYFEHGLGNGSILNAVWYVHPGHLGQYQESGRDQGHGTLGVGLLGAFAEMAWNQGDDLYGYDDSRILATAEYVARSNLIDPDTGTFHEVPYTAYGTNCSRAYQPGLSPAGQGIRRPIWEMIYNHYVHRRGLDAPYTAQMAAALRPEGHGGADEFGYGTLTFTRDPIAVGADPSGVTAIVSGRSVIVSWWGTAYATGYDVRRATTSGGPYTPIATLDAGADRTFTDTDVADGETYYYVVVARAATGETEPSDEAVAQVGVAAHAELPFDATGGTSATDATGHGWNATVVGDPVWAAGRDGNAIVLDGEDDYVSLPEGVVAGISDFTISTWVRLGAADTHARIFDFGTSAGRYIALSARSGTGNVRFASTVIGGVGEDGIDGVALPIGEWAHVAVTLSGTVGVLYVDGVEVGRNEAIRFAPFRLGTTTRNWIGRSQYDADPYLDASIDGFRIDRGARSPAEIAALAR